MSGGGVERCGICGEGRHPGRQPGECPALGRFIVEETKKICEALTGRRPRGPGRRQTVKPIEFAESNAELKAPEGQEEEVEPLPCFRGHDGTHEVVVSCWELSLRERLQLLLSGELWLGVLGRTQPPLWLSSEKPVLEDAPL